MCPPALTCVERTDSAHCAHHGRHTAFPPQVGRGAFLSKGNKICKRKKNIYQHVSHCRGSRSKTNSLFTFPSQPPGKSLLFKHGTKIVPNIFSHSGEHFYPDPFLLYWHHTQLFPTSLAWHCTMRLGQLAQLLQLLGRSTQMISQNKQGRNLSQKAEYQFIR